MKPWSRVRAGTNGIGGFFVGAFGSIKPVVRVLGDVALLLCLGASSLSKILDVLAPNCLLPYGSERENPSNLSLET